MKTVLAATVLGLLMGASPLPALATETDQGPQGAATVFTLGDDETAPGDAAPEEPATDATDQDVGGAEDAADQDKAPPDDAVMQNFTRHRPGACPEGPPCKTE